MQLALSYLMIVRVTSFTSQMQSKRNYSEMSRDPIIAFVIDLIPRLMDRNMPLAGSGGRKWDRILHSSSGDARMKLLNRPLPTSMLHSRGFNWSSGLFTGFQSRRCDIEATFVKKTDCQTNASPFRTTFRSEHFIAYIWRTFESLSLFNLFLREPYTLIHLRVINLLTIDLTLDMILIDFLENSQFLGNFGL